MLLIVGGLIIAVGTVVLVWDFLVLIGMTVVLVVTMLVCAVCWIILMAHKFIEWKKGRSEQGWEPIQTEVYGDATVEDAANFAAYVAQCGGNVIVNVVDDDNVVQMRDITPRRKRLK